MPRYLRSMLFSILMLALATGVGAICSALRFSERNILLFYGFAVFLTARFTDGYAWGLLSALGSVLLYNYYYTAPVYTLSVSDPAHFFTFALMSVTSVATSALTTKVKRQTRDALLREAQTAALYRLTRSLNHLTRAEDVVFRLASSISEITGQPANPICQKIQDELPAHAILLEDPPNRWCVPLPDAAERQPEMQKVIDAMAESAALAIHRIHSVEKASALQEETTRERYRANLLRSISHDIRSPLSGMMGSAELLLNSSPEDDPSHVLAEGIYTEASDLCALVENILSLTRLQDDLALHLEPESVEEVVESALQQMAKRYPERDISLRLPEDPVILPMDARLIRQTLVNLLDNAVKHTPPDGAISLSVRRDEGEHRIAFAVEDEGEGIPESDLGKVFAMFYTRGARGADAHRGIGLGLTICETIVHAHGGHIEVHSLPGRGSVFTFTLPMEVSHDRTKSPHPHR